MPLGFELEDFVAEAVVFFVVFLSPVDAFLSANFFVLELSFGFSGEAGLAGAGAAAAAGAGAQTVFLDSATRVAVADTVTVETCAGTFFTLAAAFGCSGSFFSTAVGFGGAASAVIIAEGGIFDSVASLPGEDCGDGCFEAMPQAAAVSADSIVGGFVVWFCDVLMDV